MTKCNFVPVDKINFLKVLSINYDKSKIKKYIVWTCQCDCGNIKDLQACKVLCGHVRSCGCIANSPKDITGLVVDQLTVISLSERKCSRNKYLRFWNCLCSCGNITVVNQSSLLRNNIKSCGCNKIKAYELMAHDYTGRRFGNLLALELNNRGSNGQSRKWKCVCNCGKIKIVPSHDLRSGHTKSCGHCYNFRNGKMVSHPQLEIHRIINKGVLNFKSGPYYIDIALVKNGKKIAIEYDSWKYHNQNIEKDKKRTEYLIQNGWSVYSIKSDYIMPDIFDIYEGLEKIIKYGYVYTELKMPDWGIRKFKNKLKK